MKKLEEIFQDKEEVTLVRDILKIVRESIFQKKDVGVPFESIRSHLAELGVYDKDGKYSTKAGIFGAICKLIEEDYLCFHPNSYFANSDKSNTEIKIVRGFVIIGKRKDNIRIGLSNSYAKNIDYKYIVDAGLV